LSPPVDCYRPNIFPSRFVLLLNHEVDTREYKSREVAQSPIYVIVHSLLEVSFAHNHFRPIAEGFASYGFDIGNLHAKGREWKVRKGRSRGLLLKDWICRKGRETGRERKGGDGKEREGSSLP